MYQVRLWSARHPRWLKTLYRYWEKLLGWVYPLFIKLGYQRLESWLFPIEKTIKGFLFDSQSCGQCVLGETGMACPMNCPKSLRNGPCGGVRANGNCEVKPEMICVWVSAWEGSKRLPGGEQAIRVVQLPVDHRRKGRSAWLWRLSQKFIQKAGSVSG